MLNTEFKVETKKLETAKKHIKKVQPKKGSTKDPDTCKPG